MKKFLAYWSNDFFNAGKRTVGEDYFTAERCYDAADIAAIAALEVGQTWRSPDCGSAHTVTRKA